MKHIPFVCLLCLVFGAVKLADAQERKPDPAQEGFVYGQVVIENRRPPTETSEYFAEVTIKDKTTGTIENAVTLSGRDVFGLRISPRPHVIILILYSIGYIADRRELTVEKNGSVAVFPPKPLTKGLLISKNLSPKGFSDLLSQQMDIFNDIDRLDVLQWNIAEYKVAFRNNPLLSVAITQFETSHRADRFMSTAFVANQPLYQQMIGFQAGQKIIISTGPLLTMMKTETLATGIRAAAIRTLSLQPTIDKKLFPEFLNFLKKHVMNSNDPLYRPSRSALTRVGSNTDKEQTIKDTRSTDPEVALAAKIALNESNLTDPVRIDEVSVDARAALKVPDRTLEAPFALETWTVWENGNAALGLDMHAFTNVDTPANKDWFSVVPLDGEQVLKVEYPEGQGFGLLQFIVAQKNAQPETRNLSRFTELIVQMRAEDDNRNVDVGIKALAPFDPMDQTKFKRTFTDISTTWQSYRIPLRGEAAQLSPYADDRQYKRLSLLQVVAELAFGDKPKQTFYIRKIFFSR